MPGTRSAEFMQLSSGLACAFPGPVVLGTLMGSALFFGIEYLSAYIALECAGSGLFLSSFSELGCALLGLRVFPLLPIALFVLFVLTAALSCALRTTALMRAITFRFVIHKLVSPFQFAFAEILLPPGICLAFKSIFRWPRL